MDRTQKLIVGIVLTVVPTFFTPLLNIPTPSPDGGKDVLQQKHTPVPPAAVAIGAVLLVCGVLLGGKALLDRTVPPSQSGPPT
ncbi:MAG: hypothetical protein KF857_01440 [Fimbriimonadaceae bacterium]|nr:hypothetical protein [Fimbriimonadaceae bacterium]